MELEASRGTESIETWTVSTELHNRVDWVIGIVEKWWLVNPFRWQLVARTITSDRTVYNSSLSFSLEFVDMISLGRNYQEAINLSFVSPRLHLNILNTEKMLQFGAKNSRRACGVSFQRKRLIVNLYSLSCPVCYLFNHNVNIYSLYLIPTLLIICYIIVII